MVEEIVINNLTVENVLQLLRKNYENSSCDRRFAESVVNDKKFYVEGVFENGNRLVALEKSYAIFGVVDTKNDLLSVFFVYEFESCNYKPKHDSFFISAHETLTEVSNDGDIDVDRTR